MKRIVFEGTNAQVKNLIDLVKNSNVDLPVTRLDYQTDNLWQTKDVLSRFKCTEEEAMGVLENALTSDTVMNEIWSSVDGYGEAMGFALAGKL